MSQKGTEPKLLRISPDQPRKRCDRGIRNSSLRFHVILSLDMRTWYCRVKQSQLFLYCSRFNHICEQTRFTSQPLLICYEDLWIIISPLSVTWKVINFINNKILPIIPYLVFQVMLFGPPLISLWTASIRSVRCCVSLKDSIRFWETAHLPLP